MRLTLATALLLPFLCLAATAGVRQQIVSYPVKGHTPAEVFEAALASNTITGKKTAFTFTIPAVKTDKKSVATGGTCRYRSYRTSLMVSVLVPKAPGLKGKDAAMFRDFTAFIKAHELEHAQRWQSCLAAMDKQALALSAGDCKALDSKAARLVSSTAGRCFAGDEAEDFNFKKEIFKQPFYRAAKGLK